MAITMIRTLLLSSLALLVSNAAVWAGPYQAGSRVAPFQAADQHGQAFRFDPASTRFLVVTHDMETGKAANAAFEKKGGAYLTERKAVYLANIHGMPGIGRKFALPKMRKYPHRIILGDDAALIANFPEQKGKATVLALAGGKVGKVSYWDPRSEGIEGYLGR